MTFEEVTQAKVSKQFMIVGHKGCGKTLLMTIFAYFYRKHWIMTNYSLNPSYFKKIEPFSIINLFTNTKLKALFIDEAHIISGKHTALRKETRLLQAILSQSRKMGMNIFLATHKIKRISRDLREDTDFFLFPEYNKQRDILSVKMYSNEYNKWKEIVIRKVSRFFKLYNTHEVIVADEFVKELKGLVIKDAILQKKFEEKVPEQLRKKIEQILK